MKKIVIIFVVILFVGCGNLGNPPAEPVAYVNPLIGTTNGGNTFPGAVVPWGMAHIVPHTTREKSWSGSRYYYGDNFIYGFGQIHLSGVGCADFANINLMPTTGYLSFDYYKNRSRYENEIAQAGYYAADLRHYNVRAEVTATERTTLSRYTFPEQQGDANIILDVTEGLTESRDAYLRIVSDDEIEGWNHAGGFCMTDNDYVIHFVANFSKKAKAVGSWKGRELLPGVRLMEGNNIGAYMQFDTEAGEQILVKIGVSFVSIENARENLEQEQPGWDFDAVKKQAQKKWNKELSRIDVSGGDREKTIFYTALYHALIHPNIIDDVNGEYPTMKTKTIEKVISGHHQYTVYSLWDTYRTLHPLLTLVYPERQADMLRTMVDHAEHGGNLPFWELGADETYVMNGDPAPIVIADSYFKGLRDFDVKQAYQAAYRTAMQTENNNMRPMQKYFSKYGYIPYDDCGADDMWGKPRMVSECLEYAYSDWAIALLAQEFGDHERAENLKDRSEAYRHYYDPKIGFLRPRYSDGSWYEPFYPESYQGSWKNVGFVEGNSWQYTLFVPHDIDGLRQIMGGDFAFTAKLQRCFDEKNFTIDNEPDINYPYLFTYIPGESWRTQQIVRRLMDLEFGTGPGGLPGNDDAGTISAWYIFSAMGFYPVCPGKTKYQLGSPVFDEITIHLNQEFWSGDKFVIRAEYNSQQNVYIQTMKLNGKDYQKPEIDHKDVVQGGELVFEMSDEH